MIDLYSWPTPNGHKITMFLEEAELAYSIKPINIRRGEGSVRIFVFGTFSRLVHGGGRRLRRTADAVVKSSKHCHSIGLINLSP